ncbi:MAG: Gfo/Idh/MocA family oxidoreductase [Chloroflexi bacterium]|nr:Gfo/Idh/MocA family oxidoreductase [Chloroflexota bacterium]
MATETNEPRVGIGLIGAGGIGALHANILTTLVRQADLIGVTDVDGSRAAACAAQFGSQSYAKVEDLLANPEVAAVIIATPPKTHCDLIKLAAGAGKDVFCEKPLGWEVEEIDDALAEVERAGVKLQVGFNKRFDANVSKVKRMVSSGDVGRLLSLHIMGRDPIDHRPAGREDGDIFLDTMIHDIDIARFVTGSEATSVYTQGGVMADEPLDDPDTVITTIRFENGSTAIIDDSRVSGHGYDQRVEAFGMKGVASFGNEQRDRVWFSTGAEVQSAGPRGGAGESARLDPPEPFFARRYLDSYVAELRSFTRVVLDDAEPVATGEDGRAAVALAVAAFRSYREGTPISL